MNAASRTGLLAVALAVVLIPAPAAARPQPPAQLPTAPGAPAKPGSTAGSTPAVPGRSVPFAAPPVPVITGAPGSAVLSTVRRQEAAVERLGEEISEQDGALTTVRQELAAVTQSLALAEQHLADRQRAADTWARDTYMTARTLPAPLAGLTSQTPALRAPRAVGARPEAHGLDVARAAVASARAAFAERLAAERALAATLASSRSRYAAAARTLDGLRSRHAAELSQARQAMDTRRQQVGDAYLADLGAAGVPGGAASPVALRALAFALAQRGKPYVWGAEGPDSYDCSGLVQAAYAHAGVRLPRTARPQWRATPGVPTAQLLPGDLLFFATDRSDWDSIHHVAIYLGGGKMLHAPTTGDVVRIAPVWWEEFFGATRVVPAVAGGTALPPGSTTRPPGGGTPPKPPAPPTPPAPSPQPPPSAGPGPGSPTPPPSPGPTPTSTASPSPTSSPGPISPPVKINPTLLIPTQLRPVVPRPRLDPYRTG